MESGQTETKMRQTINCCLEICDFWNSRSNSRPCSKAEFILPAQHLHWNFASSGSSIPTLWICQALVGHHHDLISNNYSIRLFWFCPTQLYPVNCRVVFHFHKRNFSWNLKIFSFFHKYGTLEYQTKLEIIKISCS